MREGTWSNQQAKEERVTARRPRLWLKVRTGFQIFGALLAPERFAERIMRSDYERELSRNKELASSPPERLLKFRDDLRQATVDRARLLRAAILKSFVLLTSAGAFGAVAA